MKKRNLQQEIFDNIRIKIISAVILPGVPISDKHIAEELGTSKSPVREALIRLVDHGLVQADHNRGFKVREFTVSDVRDLHVVREALEVLAIGLASDNLDKQKIQTLKGLVDQYHELVESGSLEAFIKIDEKFHLMIAQFSGNALLIKQLSSIHDQLAILRRSTHILFFTSHQRFEEAYQAHQNISELLVHGKINQAKQAMSEHIQGSLNIISEGLKNRDRYSMQA